MTTIIRDMSGQKLASVQLGANDGQQTITVKRVLEGKGTLLKYYFGKGMRKVTIENEMFQLPGTLKTHWAHNERQWRVLLDEAAKLATADLVTSDRA